MSWSFTSCSFKPWHHVWNLTTDWLTGVYVQWDMRFFANTHRYTYRSRQKHDEFWWRVIIASVQMIWYYLQHKAHSDLTGKSYRWKCPRAGLLDQVWSCWRPSRGQHVTMFILKQAETMCDPVNPRGEVKTHILGVWDTLVVRLQLNMTWSKTPAQAVVLAGPVLKIIVFIFVFFSPTKQFSFYPQDNEPSSKNNVFRCGWEAQTT